MKGRIVLLFLLITLLRQTGLCYSEEPKTLAIGSTAPDFKLKGIDNKTYSLASFSKYNLLVIIFTCNHCPTAQAYEDRIIQLAKDYTPKNAGIVAISPNDPTAVRLDEHDGAVLADREALPVEHRVAAGLGDGHRAGVDRDGGAARGERKRAHARRGGADDPPGDPRGSPRR